MKRISTLIFSVFFLFLSENVFSQTNKVNELNTGNQLVNGVNVAPNSTNLEKATPNLVVNNSSNTLVVPPKTPKQKKTVKINKYNNGKTKRDEE